MKLDWKALRSGSRALGVLAVFCWAWPLTSVAADEGADPIPKVSLDELLMLPDSFEVETSRRGGATRAEWHARFNVAEAEVSEARAALEKTLGELEALAGKSGSYKVASPFGQASPSAGEDSGSPLNYGLKQEIRRKRAEVERTERALLDLELEANLAGVPEAWHSPR
jgi:hypothetical protein